MMLLVVLLLLFSALYAWFILWCLIGWNRTLPLKIHKNSILLDVSVIVPVRNEEKTIAGSLDALAAQDYPGAKIEILVVDDCSEDQTVRVVNEFIQQHPQKNIRLITLEENSTGSKKAAITKAVSIAGNPFILTTDGDCRVPSGWIRSFVQAHYATGAEFIAGPVAFQTGGGILSSIQELEMMGLVGIAAAGIRNGKPMMCNGANIFYTKSAFETVHGFDDKKRRASGDDTQLLLKIAARDKSKIHFLKREDAIVEGVTIHSLRQLWSQRKRWASKIPATLTPFTITVAVIAWFTHALLLLCGILCCWFPDLCPGFLAASLIKMIPEFLFLHSLSNFFRRKPLLKWFLPVQPFYWAYIAIVGIRSPFGRYNWKGRMTK